MICLNKTIKCKECDLEFSVSAIASHIKSKHKITYKVYKQKHNLLKQQCEVCKKVTSNKKFCSKRCTAIYASILKNLGILDIDKKIHIDIEEFRYNLKDRCFYIENLKNKISREQFLTKYVYEKKNIQKISDELKEDIHLVYILFKNYKIPKIGTDEYKQVYLNYVIEKIGSLIKDDLNKKISQKEISKKYNLSKHIIPNVVDILSVKKVA